jgi:hypothetical protein
MKIKFVPFFNLDVKFCILVNLKWSLYVPSKQLELGFKPSPGIFGTAIIELGSAVLDRDT